MYNIFFVSTACLILYSVHSIFSYLDYDIIGKQINLQKNLIALINGLALYLA